jgi:hypothetical protein
MRVLGGLLRQTCTRTVCASPAEPVLYVGSSGQKTMPWQRPQAHGGRTRLPAASAPIEIKGVRGVQIAAPRAVDRQLQPLVPPQVSHLRQVPLRTRVKFPQEPQASPS